MKIAIYSRAPGVKARRSQHVKGWADRLDEEDDDLEESGKYTNTGDPSTNQHPNTYIRQVARATRARMREKKHALTSKKGSFKFFDDCQGSQNPGKGTKMMSKLPYVRLGLERGRGKGVSPRRAASSLRRPKTCTRKKTTSYVENLEEPQSRAQPTAVESPTNRS